MKDNLLTHDDHKMLNLKQLSQELNVSYDFTKDMRRVGYRMPFGGQTTLTHALAWLNANPNFREDAILLKRPKT